MLYHFEIALSDVDRGIYQALDFRLNQHPSENGLYLLTRALAYALSYQEDLEFSPTGLADPDIPALLSKSPMGGYNLWIEIGNPSAKRLHKASKAANNVVVYTYKNPELIVKDVATENVHRAEQIEIYAFNTKFLEALERNLKKKNTWSLLHQEGQIDLEAGEQSFATQITKMQAR
ncbi:MAG: YaeQ family protein [Bdellovibrionales bacterium]